MTLPDLSAATWITGGSILTPAGWLDPGYLAVRDGQIAALGAGEPPPELLSGAGPIVSARNRAVIPGLYNGHTHLSQAFMRGLAAGRPLLRWLKELIWPLQAALSVAELELAALLGLAENIRSGVTRLVDHQKITRSPAFTTAVARAARQSGLRVTVARAWADRGSGAEPPAAILAELEGWLRQAGPDDRVTFAGGPLVPWRCSAATLQAGHELARQYGACTHIHVSETSAEVEMTRAETGLRPVAWLDSLGVLDERCQVVHAVWVEADEIDLLARRRAPVVHCPVSNAVMGSGIAPVKALAEAGVPVWLGTDGPASNDTQDSFENLKAAICLARARDLDAAALSPRQALAMATGGARLAVGQPADLALVRLDTVWASPLHDLDSALALCARAGDVEAVMVAGEFVMSNGKITTLDEELIVKEARQAVERLRRRAGLDA